MTIELTRRSLPGDTLDEWFGAQVTAAGTGVLLDNEMNDFTVHEAVDAPRFHQQWLPDVTPLEAFAASPDTRRILEGIGRKLGPPQLANHVAPTLVGAPILGGKPVGKDRFDGANDPRRNNGLARGY